MVKRLVYETLEDVEFMALGERHGSWTKLHSRYMECFFAEDYDERGAVVQRNLSTTLRHC